MSSSRLEIASYYNRHKGESCIIIGNGPSLRDVPMNFLKGNTTFGTNKIFMLDGFVPTYYVSVNPLVIEQSWPQIADMDTTRFIREGNYPIDAGPNPHLHYLHSMSAPMFSYDPSQYIYEGHTVTFVCLELAFFMGFQKVGLVGVDHRFTYQGEPNEARVLEGPDPNHFDPNYFSGQTWNNPDLKKSEEAYKLALDAFESAGRKVYNLTYNSDLEVFPKRNVHKWTQ